MSRWAWVICALRLNYNTPLHTFTFGAWIFSLSPFMHTPDDSLDAEDSDQRTHFPQFSYSASIREWSLRQLNNQANLHTVTIPHTLLPCWGIRTTHKLKLAQDTISIWSLMHIHSRTRTSTCTGKSDKTGMIEYGMNTQAVSDWLQQVCVDRLGSFVSVRPLRVGFRLSCRTPAALHWVPHQSLDPLKTRLCQQVPPLYQLYPC